jgi:hypothetical protein
MGFPIPLDIRRPTWDLLLAGISHEYVETAIHELFHDVQQHVPELGTIIDNVRTYCHEGFGV